MLRFYIFRRLSQFVVHVARTTSLRFAHVFLVHVRYISDLYSS